MRFTVVLVVRDVLISEVSRNISDILPTAQSEFIAIYFASCGKTVCAIGYNYEKLSI